MTWTCLAVDFTDKKYAAQWLDFPNNDSAKMNLRFIKPDEFDLAISMGKAIALIVFVDSAHSDLEKLLTNFFSKIGCLPRFQMVVCDNPSIDTLATTFEFGLATMHSTYLWQQKLLNNLEAFITTLNNPEFVESKIYSLRHNIKNNDHKKIKLLSDSLVHEYEYDYLAAFIYGRTLEVLGQYEDAQNVYTRSIELNELFMPAKATLAELLLTNRKAEEAIEIFEMFDQINPSSPRRNALLAICYLELDQIEKAEEYLSLAASLDPTEQKVKEAQALLFIKKGDIKGVLTTLNEIEDAGPYFASKINEMSVKYSKDGQSEKALSLYKRTHKIVRKELKYKISLNAALACRRKKLYDDALKYIHRCKREYGGTFPKLSNLEKSTRELKEKSGS